MKILIIFFTVLVKLSLCRDYYVGMYRKNDIMVASDTLYKEKNFFGSTTARYGRVFRCPITYFKVSDRLGMGRPPNVIVTRGGLGKKYITLLLTSSYDTPIAVNINIACEGKAPKIPMRPPPTEAVTAAESAETTTEAAAESETNAEEPAEGAENAETTQAEEAAPTEEPAPPAK